MTDETLPNRWKFVGWSLVMQLCLGNLYTWSIFRNPLMAAHGWTVQEATVPFTLSIVCFAVGMVLGGRWQDRVGPRRVAVTGGVIFGTGLLLASVIGDTLWGLYFAYGMLGGLGVGFAYVTPIATCVKWFPDMRGFITGLAVLGFGAGSMIGAPVGTHLIGTVGVFGTFALFGGTLGVLTALAGGMLRNPPPGYRPAGWTPPVAAGGGGGASRPDYTPGEMVGTVQFYLLWTIYLFWSGVGLMAISQAVPMGVELAGLDTTVAAGALGTMAVFNGLGRPAFGAVSDRLGRVVAAILAQGVYVIALVGVLPQATTLATYTLGISLIGFAYGGGLGVMPAFTADYFGTKNLGINYGWIYSAWGAAGVLGPIIGSQVREQTGAWTDAFWILAGLAVAAAVLALVTKAPAPRPAAA